MKIKPGFAAVVYTGLSLLGSALFLMVTASGGYSGVERIGGSVWIFILLMIVLMPAITGLTKK
ncbi:MAG: hypothetical protein P3T54_06190 [Dehalogenimonas sp.]|uniref:Dehalogenase n=1 Tax=Candidatus Dehalogenimonas loeffleri TaxID=3127115 RepID=A0ABZ2JBP7_9CHLR|nr:hypothetical protein [Dehalogenimonas sp.]